MRSPDSWMSRITSSLVTVVLVAATARLAWELLRPLVGVVVVLAITLTLVAWMLNRFRRF